MNEFEIVIIGGGIVGLSAAIAMRQRGFTVALIDSGTLDAEKTKGSRAYAINRTASHLLDTLGVWSHIPQIEISPYRAMHVWDALGGAHFDLNSRAIRSNQLGIIIKEHSLKKPLLQVAADMGVIFFPNHAVIQIETHQEAVRLESCNNSWQARLLIAADGANSKTRDLLQVPVTSWPYQQYAIVTTVQTELPHRKTAYQVFNPNGPLAFLPLRDEHQCSIVWTTTPIEAKALMQLEDEQFSEQLTQAFAGKLGACTTLSPRHQFPLVMRHANRYAGERWLLMGDAAHSIHPLAGLGLNLGLADLNSWLTLCDQKPLGSNYAKQLSAYQRQRKHAIWQVILVVEGLKRMFGSSLPAVTTLRGVGVKVFNEIPLLKRFIIKQAAEL